MSKARIWEGQVPGSHEKGWKEPHLIERGVPPVLRETIPGARDLHCFDFGTCSVILGFENKRWHISIAHSFRHPSWDEIKTIRYRLGGPDRTFAIILPIPDEYVNVPSQDHVFHLWELIKEVDW